MTVFFVILHIITYNSPNKGFYVIQSILNKLKQIKNYENQFLQNSNYKNEIFFRDVSAVVLPIFNDSQQQEDGMCLSGRHFQTAYL